MNNYTEEQIDEILFKTHKFTQRGLEAILRKYDITKEQLVDVIKGYELSQEQLDETVKKICDTLTFGKNQQKRPIAIIVGGQSGSGKTAIIGYATKCIQDDCIIIDNDFYREFHPNIDEINSKYQDLMTECTDQLSFYATPIIIEKMINDKYNLVIHQTLKGNRIADDAMKKLKDAGYVVGVMALAVSSLESNMSMTERCLEQLKLDGTCRWVAQDNHDIAFNGLPTTVDYIENCPNWNVIFVVERGIEDPTNPRVIYTSYNQENTVADMQTLAQYFDIRRNENDYKSAKEAVLKGREHSEQEFLAKADKRIAEAESDEYVMFGDKHTIAKERIEYIKNLVAEKAAEYANGSKKD